MTRCAAAAGMGGCHPEAAAAGNASRAPCGSGACLPCIPAPGRSPRSERTGCRPPWPQQPAGGGQPWGRAHAAAAAPPPEAAPPPSPAWLGPGAARSRLRGAAARAVLRAGSERGRGGQRTCRGSAKGAAEISWARGRRRLQARVCRKGVCAPPLWVLGRIAAPLPFGLCRRWPGLLSSRFHSSRE